MGERADDEGNVLIAARLQVSVYGGGVTGRLKPDPTSFDFDQLDVEDEHALRRAGFSLVSEVLGDPETGALAFDHQRHPFGPPGDHATEVHGPRLALYKRA